MSKHDSNFKSKMIQTKIVISQPASQPERKQMNKKNKRYVYVNLQCERMQMGQKEKGDKKIENTEQK